MDYYNLSHHENIGLIFWNYFLKVIVHITSSCFEINSLKNKDVKKLNSYKDDVVNMIYFFKFKFLLKKLTSQNND